MEPGTAEDLFRSRLRTPPWPPQACPQRPIQLLHVRAHVCMYVFIYVYARRLGHVCVGMYVCMHMCVCVCVCMYAYMYVPNIGAT